jgi:hypothetical protein
MLGPVLAAVAAIGVVIVAALLCRRVGRDRTGEDPGGQVAPHVGAMLSALFLLAFALAIVVPWTTADAASENTYVESQAIVEAYWSADRLPAPADGQVQAQLRDYLGLILDKEWPLMAEGRLSPDGWARLDALRTQVTNLRVTDADAMDAKSDLLDQIQDMSGARRLRAADAVASPPPVVLGLTVVTGAAVLLFPFLGGARLGVVRLVPLMVMAALLGVGVYLAFDISHVFRGGLAVGPDAFQAALDGIHRMPGGG